MSFIYLASPYSSQHPEVMQARADAAMEFTARRLHYGEAIYSPIVHCHELALKHRLPKNFDFWQKYNFAMLSKASDLWVLMLEGWQESKGVAAEVELAAKLSIPVSYYNPHPQVMR